MEMTEFFRTWRGKYLDFDGVYGGQCVDVIKQYTKDVLKMTPRAGDAISYWILPPPGFKKIVKGWFNHPEPGDIIIFDIGEYGHIGVCNWYRWSDLNIFQQNDPLGAPCEFKTYSYKNVLGWLRPEILDVDIACIGANIDFGDELRKYSEGKITAHFRYYKADIEYLTQDDAYELVKKIRPREKFVFIFYKPNNISVFYATFYDPFRNGCITNCPAREPRLLTFELSHQLQYWYNANRGQLPRIEVVDSNFPTDELIKSKLKSVLPYMDLFK